MTGDVFSDINVPGVEDTDGDDERLAMVAVHPCSMRDGYTMKPALQVMRVLRTEVIELNAWRSHYDRMPLPNLFGRAGEDDVPDPDDSYAVIFDLRGRVRTTDLALEKRVACLSEEGVGFLHQRMGHCDTRYAARVADLMAACAAPFVEAELAEEWNRKVLDPDELVDPIKRDEHLAESAKNFDDVLSTLRTKPQMGKKSTRYRLRDDLAVPRKTPAARREILKIINELGG
jgi:hypothetical protein